jgi:glycosyltransferase involved in cell wall biosynthesis
MGEKLHENFLIPKRFKRGSDMYLSVIIPTRNRSTQLKKAIESLTLQTYQRENFEIIIVDNGSTDETRNVVESCKQYLPNMSYIYEPKLGLHIGRHAGLAIAKGEILVYGDDDIEAFPTWLEGIAESFQDPNVSLVGGNDLPRFESAPPDWVEQMWQKTPWGKTIGVYSLIDFGNEVKKISPHYVYGCNFSIRKKVLLEVGGFHPDGMPDDLLKYRGDGESAVSDGILLNGYKTLFNPKASVYHWVPKSRMSMEYVYKRGYIQGISNSYADIRKDGKLSRTKGFQYSFKRLINIFNLVIKKLLMKKRSPIDYFYTGYLDGLRYHHRITSNDKEMLDWILKKDYFETVEYQS